MNFKSLTLAGAASLLIFTSACSHNEPQANSEQLNAHRSAKNIARDQYRNPQQTLNFFELKANSTVVEIWPGGGWYTEVLAPRLPQGKLIAAHWSADSEVKFFRNMFKRYQDKLTATPELYSNVELTVLEPPKHIKMAADNSADLVLTFRNVHNWMRNQQEQNVFNSAYSALKPGGIFGVVEHRAPENFDLEQMIESGYVSESYVKQLAEKTGFEFVASSEINANVRDNKRHPKGVWTLPPSLRLGDTNKAEYLAIGESDRMTLKFRKPF